MLTRNPIVAGQFYPAAARLCTDEIEEYLKQITLPDNLPETIVAGIVPHAGWAFSGQLALQVFAAIKQQNKTVDTFCIFGAAHSYFGTKPAVFDKGSWQTPLGKIDIDEQLARQLITETAAVGDTGAHAHEHSIEVQVPFVQHLFPDAKILPVIVPPGEHAVALGEKFGDIIVSAERKIVCIGSTDLTHYGPRYGFTPMGIGPEAISWAANVNDRQFIDLALKLDGAALLANAVENLNACGPGAAAATVCAAKKLGKAQGLLLAHTNSNEIMKEKMHSSSTDSVGYAAIIF